MLLNCGVRKVSWDFSSLWTTRRSNQSILKAISPEYTLEGLMLKLQYFGYLKQRANLLKKTLVLGKIEAGEGEDRWWDGWMASPTQWTWFEQAPGDGEGQGSLECCSPWSHRFEHSWATEQQQPSISRITWQERNWTPNSTRQPSLGLFLISEWKGFKTKTAPKNWPTALQQPFAGVLLLAWSFVANPGIGNMGISWKLVRNAQA